MFTNCEILDLVVMNDIFSCFSGTLTDHAKGTSRKVAIKIPKVSCVQQHTEELKDFYLEAQVSFSLQHKNVLLCLGITRDIVPWLVFEYMEHGDLAEILRQASFLYTSHV